MYKALKSFYKGRKPTEMLVAAGAALGGLAGVALPLYIGWEAGEYVKNALEFGTIVGTATEMIGAVGLTSLIGGATVPIGMAGGAATGGLVGAAVQKGRRTIDRVVSE